MLLVEPAKYFVRVDILASVELSSPFLNEHPHTVELRLSVGFLVLDPVVSQRVGLGNGPD